MLFITEQSSSAFMKFVYLVIEYSATAHPNERRVADQKKDGMNLTRGFFLKFLMWYWKFDLFIHRLLKSLFSLSQIK